MSYTPLDDYQKVLDYMTGHNDCDVYDVHSDWIIEEIKKLKEENLELSKKSNAKSDIIRNMMDVFIKKADIDDGFYIGREWGNKYIDEWNKIVDEEFKKAVDDINNYDYDEVRLETDGYQFDFCSPEEEEEDEDQ
jgi:hypothetical protein